MRIDCDSCEVRGPACDDCMVTALLGPDDRGDQLDATDRAAIDVLASSGLISTRPRPQLAVVHQLRRTA